ncbi:MAG: phytoene/squalene synthase family protein [Microbacteriaceae bacterium]
MTRLSLYSAVAQKSASLVIRDYSTSFGLASRILERESRQHIENIYALVRLADEVVDGVAVEAGLDNTGVRRALDDLERDTYQAMESGYSTNLIVHAFALSARAVGITRDIVEPFFTSMRMDLSDRVYTAESFATYVYGSAEVVGLMCLAVFVRNNKPIPTQAHVLVAGARSLGAAFQKVNFLRDLAADVDGLGRSYFPGVRIDTFSEIDKKRICDDIDDDLARAAETLPLLPADARRAVALAHGLFHALNERIRRTPADVLKTTRISVSTATKLTILVRVLTGGAR